MTEISIMKSQAVPEVPSLFLSVGQDQGKALWQSAPSLSNKLVNTHKFPVDAQKTETS